MIEIDRKIEYAKKLLNDFIEFKGKKFIKGIETGYTDGNMKVSVVTSEGTSFLMGNIEEEHSDYVTNELNKFLKSRK